MRRRFKDFEAFHELLLARYLYRLVPRLPPKKLPMSQSGAFIEQRRRSLKRFLILIVRHPILSRDEITTCFFTTTSGQVRETERERDRVRERQSQRERERERERDRERERLEFFPQDIGSRMKEKFKNNKDEYWFNDLAKKAEELLSDAARVKYDRVKEQVTAMHTITASMLQVHTH